MINILPKFIKKRFDNPILNKNCTEFEINNWIVSDFIIKKLVLVVGITPFPINEQFFMVTNILRFKPTHIFEWGTHVGKSARIFYETTQAFNIHCEIHSIDLPDDINHIEHPKNRRGKLVRNIKSVHLHQGDGLDDSLKIYKNITNECRPLFFLDGDHSYESVKRELEGIIKAVSNPIILIHDTFYQSKESGYNVGPHKAVKYIMKKYPRKFYLISTNTGLPGMTLIYPKEKLRIRN